MTVQEAKILINMILEEATSDEHAVSYVTGCQAEELKIAIECMEEVEQYRALGTVEELKEAREKQVASKWIECPYADLIMCPSCNAEFSTIDNCTEQFEYCPKCGKRLE